MTDKAWINARLKMSSDQSDRSWATTPQKINQGDGDWAIGVKPAHDYDKHTDRSWRDEWFVEKYQDKSWADGI